MTTATTTTRPANVFDADLPVLDYHDLPDPAEAHARLAVARTQAPIGLGPYGPEVLRYAEVHTVLRDPRFINPRFGIGRPRRHGQAAVGPCHRQHPGHRRRRAHPAAGWSPKRSPLARSLAWRDWCTRPPPDWSTPWPPPDPVTSSPGLPALPDSDHLRPAGAPAQDWRLFSGWADAIAKIFDWNLAHDGPEIEAAWDELDAYLDAMVSERRTTLTDDLISELIRAGTTATASPL